MDDILCNLVKWTFTIVPAALNIEEYSTSFRYPFYSSSGEL